MKDARGDDRLDGLLAAIEFPGEEAHAVRSFLDGTRLADKVMARVGRGRSRRSMAWAAFAAAAIALLCVLGASDAVRDGFFGLQETLSRCFFSFLAIVAMGGIFGFVLSIDTARFTRWARKHI